MAIQNHHLHTHTAEPLYNVVKAENEPRWICVKDAMPAGDEDVLTWDGATIDIGSVIEDCDEGRRIWVDSPSSREVTHWMNLPKPPKEEK